MSNYRVRQVMKLRRSQRQKDFLTGLATFMTDDRRTARAGFDAVMEAAGQSRNTARLARRELEEAGDLKSGPTGTGRGHVTEWIVLCLPESSPESAKGVSAVNPVSYVDPLPDGKGVNPELERGSNDTEKGGQGQAADQQEPNTLNSSAKQSASLSPPAVLHADLADVVPDVTERETQAVIEILRKRGAKSVGAVLRAEIRDGTARALVDEVRRQGLPPTGASAARPCDTQFSDQCPRCGRTHHDPRPCTEIGPPVAVEVPAPRSLQLAEETTSEKPKCRYHGCLGRAEAVNADGYHPGACAYLVNIRPRVTTAEPIKQDRAS